MITLAITMGVRVRALNQTPIMGTTQSTMAIEKNVIRDAARIQIVALWNMEQLNVPVNGKVREN